MVQYKSNVAKNTGELNTVFTGGNVGTATATKIKSIDIPEQCDEFRFRFMLSSTKNIPMYSFNDRFNRSEWNSQAYGQTDLSHIRVPMTDGNSMPTRYDGTFAYSEWIIVREPSAFGSAIFFSLAELGASDGFFGVQYQIIGGCNPNGY
tara:strand:+ start:7895 stop:8341 length:447 start_codon:yes stop_codon:yes gene_type:complete